MSATHDHAPATRVLAAQYSSRAAYARYWAPVIHPMARVLLASLPLDSARRIVDLGCGTGELAGDLRVACPGAQLIGADRAEGMVRVAKEAVACNPLVMDAQAVALQSASIDVAVLAFMLFHVPDPAAALREVRRILRPGACVGITTWAPDPGTPSGAIWTEELDACGAAPDPRDPAVMGHERIDSPAKLAQLLEEAGLAPPRIWSQAYTHLWVAEELFEMMANYGAPNRRLVSLPAATAARCCERVRPRVAALSAEERVQHMEVLYVVARRPD